MRLHGCWMFIGGRHRNDLGKSKTFKDRFANCVLSASLLSVLLLIGFPNFTAAETSLFIQSLAEKAAEAEAQKYDSRFWQRGLAILCARTAASEHWTILGRLQRSVSVGPRILNSLIRFLLSLTSRRNWTAQEFH